MDRMAIFSSRLKEWRIKKKLTQQQLGERAGCTTATVFSYESGNVKNPSLSIAVKLAEALNLSMDWLLGFRSTYPESKLDPSVLHPKTRVIDYDEINKYSYFDTISYFKSYVRVLVDLSTTAELSSPTVVKLEQSNPILSDFLKKANGLVTVYHDGAISAEVFDKAIDDLIDKYTDDYIYAYDNLFSIDEYTEISNKGKELLPDISDKNSISSIGKVEYITVSTNISTNDPEKPKSEKEVPFFISPELLKYNLEKIYQ